jgi:DNA (cytosine-5)-methyltransferase 1
LYNHIPVIDLFAGPGGLAEGFSLFYSKGVPAFKVALSIEKDPHAHRTLELRSFVRQFPKDQLPGQYYAYLRQEITREKLFDAYPEKAEAAAQEAWCAELGADNLSEKIIDERIHAVLQGRDKWVLIGGPPCQAYSLVGRSRNKGKLNYVPENDNRHFLYREYLRIIARHWPAVFVMENVKGLLSARINGSRIFNHILADLHNPLTAMKDYGYMSDKGYKYTIYSITKPVSYPVRSSESQFSPTDFLVKCEDFGIPQARHRVILVGVREDLNLPVPMLLFPQEQQVCAASVLDDLPKLRSGLSRSDDSFDSWQEKIWGIIDDYVADEGDNKWDKDVWDRIEQTLLSIDAEKIYDRGGNFISFSKNHLVSKWFHDPMLKGVCNHISKTHMPSDLHRYMFASCFAQVRGKSPSLPEFPQQLWPEHKNVHNAKLSGNFSDRFRVQMASRPATTIMSHIAKDGHYYIHYDPSQCRSLTVREAARLQTFPDNYFFEGTRTQQYTQVGNAVPPLLACQIAEIVYDLLCEEG